MSKKITDTFWKKLKENEQYEEEAQHRILEKFIHYEFLNRCHDHRYDIQIVHSANNKDTLKFEVKCDHLSNKYPNFFIEFEQYNKPSGIQTTEAKYYIITNTVKYYMIKVSTLNDIIAYLKGKYSLSVGYHKTIDEKGIEYRTYGFKIPQCLIINNSVEI